MSPPSGLRGENIQQLAQTAQQKLPATYLRSSRRHKISQPVCHFRELSRHFVKWVT